MDQIIDLFPMLKELYDQGPHDAFYVVKVWVKINPYRSVDFPF